MYCSNVTMCVRAVHMELDLLLFVIWMKLAALLFSSFSDLLSSSLLRTQLQRYSLWSLWFTQCPLVCGLRTPCACLCTGTAPCVEIFFPVMALTTRDCSGPIPPPRRAVNSLRAELSPAEPLPYEVHRHICKVIIHGNEGRNGRIHKNHCKVGCL